MSSSDWLSMLAHITTQVKKGTCTDILACIHRDKCHRRTSTRQTQNIYLDRREVRLIQPPYFRIISISQHSSTSSSWIERTQNHAFMHSCVYMQWLENAHKGGGGHTPNQGSNSKMPGVGVASCPEKRAKMYVRDGILSWMS